MIAIFSWLSLVFLFITVFYLYNEYRVDKLRQSLFETRDALFDEARAGHISFTAPGYRATWFLINGMIRFGHKASLSQLLVARCMLTNDNRQFVRSMYEAAAYDGCTEAERLLCEKYRQRANVCIAAHLLTSPTLFVIAVPMLAFSLAHAGTNVMAKMMVERFKTAFNAFDRAAFEMGKQVGRSNKISTAATA